MNNEEIMTEQHSPNGDSVCRIFREYHGIGASNPRLTDENISIFYSSWSRFNDAGKNADPKHDEIYQKRASEIEKTALAVLPLYYYAERDISGNDRVEAIESYEGVTGIPIGVAYITKETIKKIEGTFALENIEDLTVEELQDLIRKEIKELNFYLNDEVYRGVIYSKGIDGDGNAYLVEEDFSDVHLGDEGYNFLLSSSCGGDWVEKNTELVVREEDLGR